MAVIARGEVWVARLTPVRGGEIGKARPVVVLQDDRLTGAGLATVLIAPLTTRLFPGTEPLRVAVAPRGRLLQPSYVVVEQVRALDRSRFADGPLTRLTPGEMAAVERRLLAVAGMPWALAAEPEGGS